MRLFLFIFLALALLLPYSVSAEVCILNNVETGNVTCIDLETNSNLTYGQQCKLIVDNNSSYESGEVSTAGTCEIYAIWNPEDFPQPTSTAKPDNVLPVIELENPLGPQNTDIRLIVGRIIQVAMGLLGTITLLVFFAGAYQWMTSAGYPQRVQKGIQTMLFAIIGLFVIFASYGILDAYISALTTGTIGG